MPILIFGEVHYSSRTVQGVFFLHCLTLEDKDTTFSETSGATHLTTQYHTPDNLNPQQHRRENLILAIFIVIFRLPRYTRNITITVLLSVIIER